MGAGRHGSDTVTTNTLVIIITVAVVLAATAVYAFATRDLGRHAADPFVILEVHEEYPPPPQTSPAGTANVQDMTPPPPAAATSRPHTHDDGGSQGTRPGAGPRTAGVEPGPEPGAPHAGARDPAPATWTSDHVLAAEIWATRPWADDTGSFEAIAAGWT